MQGFSKTIFCLFDNWQQFKSIMRKKKKEQTPSQNYWPAHPKPCTYWRMGVCVCVYMGFSGTQNGTSSVPCPPVMIRGSRLCSHWAQVSLGKLFFQLKLSFSLRLPTSFQTLPQFPGLLSEKIIWIGKWPSLQNSLGNRNCLNSDTHTDIENTTWMYGYVICVRACACVCTVAIAKKGPYSFPY